MTLHRLALRAALALPLVLAACGGSKNTNTPADAKVIVEPPDAGIADAAPPADANCIDNPTTSQELMNACTTATKVAKDPTLTLQYQDGGLPPLP
jgi:predicted outer membrane protein